MSAAGRAAPLDALVLGAGNVGLATALLLARQGLSVRVADRRPPAAWTRPAGFDARVYALNPGVQSVLRDLEVWRRLDPARIGTIQEMAVHGDSAAVLRFDGGTAPLAEVVEDGALQAALAEALTAYIGPEWLMVTDPVAAHFDPLLARLDCGAAGVVSARLLIGADGARSWLREQIGSATQIRDYRRQGVVVNFRCERPHGGVARQWFSQGEVIALLPLGGAHVSLVWSAHDALAETLCAGSPGTVTDALAARIGTPLGALEEISPARAFPLRLMKVTPVHGTRAVLVGDAAHGVHPLAGQGLNLGMGDAVCLAQTIAQRGAGPDPGDRAVLRRHARRRAEPVMAMQAVTDGMHRLFDLPGPAARFVRNAGLDLVDRSTLLKSLLAAGAAGQDAALTP